MKTEVERFLESYEMVTESGCWIWTKAVEQQEYPIFWSTTKKGTVRGHRYSYELFVGPISDGLLICHRCDVTCCVNPGHLFPGTHTDNYMDAEKKGRNRGNIRLPHCMRGHVYTPETTIMAADGKRRCRICSRLIWQKRKLRIMVSQTERPSA